MPTRVLLSLAAVLCAAAAATCGGQADDAPPVATPSVTFAKSRVPLGSPVDATFRFEVAPDARIEGDYRVLVHFLDIDGELMWADDHDPPVPTSQWTSGQVVEYTRTLFIPIYPYVGEAALHVGLYSPKDQSRLPLAGATEGMREYRVAGLELLPHSENVFLLFKDGWHAPEVAGDNTATEWQWTKKTATITFRNPRKPSTLYLHADNPRSYAETQTVNVSVNGQQVDAFQLAPQQETIHRTMLTAEQLGAGDMIDLTLEVDKTWVPALVPDANSRDARELGIRVFHAYVEPQG